MPLKLNLTRLAPTPSGYLHLGNIASFAVTAYLARRSGARILLRIDDGDAERTREEYLDDIFETLRFLGIPWDLGPADTKEFKRNYSQQVRLPLYQDALQKLAAAQQLFACNCSRSLLSQYPPEKGYPGFCLKKPLSLDAEGVAWRLSALPQQKLSLIRFAGPGSGTGFHTVEEVLNYPDAMRQFVIRKKDGFPAYQLCSLIDDLTYGVDLIVRGEDLLDSTAAQLFLADVLGESPFRETIFFHHPLITDASGEKLSKSAGATSIKAFRENGSTAADVFRAIAAAYGITEAPVNWEELAGLLLERWLG